MATSGLYRPNITGSEIITEALSVAGVYTMGETIPDDESADAIRTLNLMLKAMQRKFGLWLNREVALFLQDDQTAYELGPTGDHCSPSWAKTELAADANSGATTFTIDATTDFGDTFDRDGIAAAQTPAGAGSLTLDGVLVSSGIATLSGQRKVLIYSDGNDSGVSFVITGLDAEGVSVTESVTGPNATTVYSSKTYKTVSSVTISGAGTGNIEVGQVGDPVGIELDGGSVQWSYLGSALSTTITPIDALTGAAATDNHVYSYTERTPRPVSILESRLRRSSGYDTPLNPMSRDEYQRLSNKTNEATPNQIYYDKQLTNGILNVWPEPNDVQDFILMSIRIPIQIIESLTNDIEIADEFGEMLAWNLALRLFPKYQRPIDPLVAAMAAQMYDDALMSDNEDTSIYIVSK